MNPVTRIFTLRRLIPLKGIYEVVTSHASDSQYICIYLAWAYVLSCLVKKAEETKDIPESYATFFESILPVVIHIPSSESLSID